MRLAGTALVAALLSSAPGIAAETGEPSAWQAEKCRRYAASYEEAVGRLTSRGIGDAFARSHAAFVASGCTAPADVCPRSDEELRLANVLVMLGMNRGLSSTFMPFACRKAS